MKNDNRLLKRVLKESIEEEYLTPQKRKEFIENVYAYPDMGETIYRSEDLKKLASDVKKLTQIAEPVVLGVVNDWFDQTSVKKDMKVIREQGIIFEKTCKELAALQFRLESAYDEIGNKLNKYFDMKDSEMKAKNIEAGDFEDEETEIEIPEEPTDIEAEEE